LTSLPEFEKPAEGPRWEEQSTFRFATFNTLNLFDDADNPYSWDEATPAKPRRQLEALAKTIRHLNADVVALEEVENRGYLERFLEVFLPDLGYEHVVEFDGNDDRGINVALISRIPVGEVRSNRHVEFPGPDGKPMRFARDVLNVTLQPSPTQSIQIWIVHLLSNFQGRDYAERYRVAEAREIRELLDEELDSDANARIVVAGDFNDTWGSETLRTVIGTGSTALWSTSLDCHESSPITYNQKPYLSMIDFILCSPAMKYQYVKGSYRVEPGSPDESGSDHNPVVVEFNTKPVIEVSSR
jgi:endonuclease/exonuclease/phosphatase family metal-dependent hydrolase